MEVEDGDGDGDEDEAEGEGEAEAVEKHPQNSNNSMYKHNLGPEQSSALSVIIAHSWALKVIANFGVSQFTKFRVAYCHCLST